MPGHPITKYEDTPISGLPVNVPNGICGLDGAGQVAVAQLGNVPAALPGTFTQIATFTKIDGSFTTGNTGGVFVDFPGLNSLFFTPTVTGSSALIFLDGNGATSGSNPGVVSVNLELDGVDLVLGSEGDGVGSGSTVQGLASQLHQGCGINGGGGKLSAVVLLTGLASLFGHTLKLRVATFTPFGAGVIYASAVVPFRLIVLFQ